MYSLCSWETTAIDCYVNQEFGKVCVLLPMLAGWIYWVHVVNIVPDVVKQAWREFGWTGFCGRTLRLHWAQAPHLHPHSAVQWGTALLMYLVLCLNRSEHPWNQHPGVCCSWATAGNCEQWFLLFWKLSELLGEWKLCSKWQKYFPTSAMYIMSSSEKCQDGLSGNTGKDWEGSPETGVLLVVPLKTYFLL